jgi:hypothetical protein
MNFGGHISYLLDPNCAFHMSKSKVSSRPTTLVVKLLSLEAVYVSESAPKDHAVLGCENISWAELISLVNIQVPGVLRVDASVLGLFGVLFTSCLDLWRATWSSLEVLDELIPKVSSLTLISCVNNKLQNWHARPPCLNLARPRASPIFA